MIKITLQGEKEIQQKIKALEKDASDALRKVVEKTVVRVEKNAKRLSPVDTGRLRASIAYEVKSESNKHQGRVGTNVEYAPIVEFGGAIRKPKPFLFPAAKQSLDFFIRLIDSAIKGLSK